MENIITNMMKQFERTDKQSFKNSEYIIKNPSRMVGVIRAINKFPKLKQRILGSSVGDINDNIVKNEFKKLKNLLNTNEAQVGLKIVAIEKTDRRELLSIINKEIVDNNDLDNELQRLIKSKKDGLDYAVALGVIDDYIDYIEKEN